MSMSLKELLKELTELSETMPLDTEVIISHYFQDGADKTCKRDIPFDRVLVEERNNFSTDQVIILDDVSYLYAHHTEKDQYIKFPSYMEFPIVDRSENITKELPF